MTGSIATCPYPACAWTSTGCCWETAADALDDHVMTHTNRLGPRGPR